LETEAPGRFRQDVHWVRAKKFGLQRCPKSNRSPARKKEKRAREKSGFPAGDGRSAVRALG